MSDERITTLLAAGTPEAAAELNEIAETAGDKEHKKAARRALFQLGQRGIHAPERIVERPLPLISRLRTLPPIRAYLSASDGAGNRLLMLSTPDPDGGSPTLLHFLLNDEEGIKDFFSRRLPRTELNELLQRYEDQLEEGLAFAEVEIEEARRLIAIHRAIHLQRRTPSPPGMLDWLPRIGSPSEEGKAEEAEKEIFSDLPSDPASLFTLKWFQSWFLDRDLIWPWLARLAEIGKSRIEVSENIKAERFNRLVGEAADALIDAETRARYRERLRSTADILRRSGKEREARIALLHADALGQERPTREVPFARALVERTLIVAMMTIQEEAGISPEIEMDEIPEPDETPRIITI